MEDLEAPAVATSVWVDVEENSGISAAIRIAFTEGVFSTSGGLVGADHFEAVGIALDAAPGEAGEELLLELLDAVYDSRRLSEEGVMEVVLSVALAPDSSLRGLPLLVSVSPRMGALQDAAGNVVTEEWSFVTDEVEAVGDASSGSGVVTTTEAARVLPVQVAPPWSPPPAAPQVESEIDVTAAIPAVGAAAAMACCCALLMVRRRRLLRRLSALRVRRDTVLLVQRMLAEAEDPAERLLMGSKTKAELLQMTSSRKSDDEEEQQPTASQTSERRLTLRPLVRPLMPFLQHRSAFGSEASWPTSRNSDVSRRPSSQASRRTSPREASSGENDTDGQTNSPLSMRSRLAGANTTASCHAASGQLQLRTLSGKTLTGLADHSSTDALDEPEQTSCSGKANPWLAHPWPEGPIAKMAAVCEEPSDDDGRTKAGVAAAEAEVMDTESSAASMVSAQMAGVSSAEKLTQEISIPTAAPAAAEASIPSSHLKSRKSLKSRTNALVHLGTRRASRRTSGASQLPPSDCSRRLSARLIEVATPFDVKHMDTEDRITLAQEIVTVVRPSTSQKAREESGSGKSCNLTERTDQSELAGTKKGRKISRLHVRCSLHLHRRSRIRAHDEAVAAAVPRRERGAGKFDKALQHGDGLAVVDQVLDAEHVVHRAEAAERATMNKRLSKAEAELAADLRDIEEEIARVQAELARLSSPCQLFSWLSQRCAPCTTRYERGGVKTRRRIKPWYGSETQHSHNPGASKAAAAAGAPAAKPRKLTDGFGSADGFAAAISPREKSSTGPKSIGERLSSGAQLLSPMVDMSPEKLPPVTSVRTSRAAAPAASASASAASPRSSFAFMPLDPFLEDEQTPSVGGTPPHRQPPRRPRPAPAGRPPGRPPPLPPLPPRQLLTPPRRELGSPSMGSLTPSSNRWSSGRLSRPPTALCCAASMAASLARVAPEPKPGETIVPQPEPGETIVTSF